MTEVSETQMVTGAAPVIPPESRNRQLAALAFVRGAALLPVIVALLIIGSFVSPVFLSVSVATLVAA